MLRYNGIVAGVAVVMDVVGDLIRWEESGALWRVVARTPGSLTISMCSCDGLEEMQRVRVEDPETIAWVNERGMGQ